MNTAVVIDDSPIMRRSLKGILESAGIRVVGEAASGDDALALYEQFRPTLMTMDIVMPGKDGLTAASELLRVHPEATIIMCSSLAARDKILACQRAGVKHYLLKPFDAAKARAIIEFTLARLGKEQPRGAAERAV
jgi:two-component system chemotaxis response regulator CheY